MAIVRSGVRVRKANTPTDDSLPAKKKLKSRSNVGAVPDSGASDDSELGDMDAEICQVGDSRCPLPHELFNMTDLTEVLSLETWNFSLTEEERESLCSFLPNLDEESYRRTLKELFAGGNFHFGSPLSDLCHRLKSGLCHPKVIRSQESLKYLQRKEHYHSLRQYHNGMVKSFVEMQNLWSNYPDAEMEERLKLLHVWKSKLLPSGPSNVSCVTPHRLMTDQARSKGGSKVKASLKFRRNVEESDRKLHKKELKVKKRSHKGVLKMVPEGLLNRHSISELAALETVSSLGTDAPVDTKLKKTVCCLEVEESSPSTLAVKSFVDSGIANIDKLLLKKRQEKRGNGIISGSKRKRVNENSESELESKMTKEEQRDISLSRSLVEAKFFPDGKFQKQVQKENKENQKEGSDDTMDGTEPKKTYKRRAEVEGEDIHHESESTLGLKADWNKEVKNSEFMAEFVTRDSPNGKQWKNKGKRRIQGEESLPSNLVNVTGLGNTSSKVSKKSAHPLVPPSALSFPFSILHLLSAVRAALLAPDDRPSESSNPNQELLAVDMAREGGSLIFSEACIVQHNGGSLQCNDDLNTKNNGPLIISFKQLVKRVQAVPGDLRILETQEPLEGLVRGVLKVLSCKTAQPGIKGWKPLVAYDKVVRGWTWVGPLPLPSLSFDLKEVQTSAEAWAIPQRMLYKVQDVFADWLRNAQETLQLFGQLRLPPLPPMLPSLDEKERFRELKAQKSLITITLTSEDMRAYFRREEAVRYSIPDMAFSYTTADGQKSTVAPLRRIAGKPNSKARDHFMLKPNRPSHVTILCLVRDAAARLPHSTGTRADVCALIRDSQYIVENFSDTQLNQVVSGALDRLHYERDPCVRYDGERKLWVYLHSDREEEDFEDNGTSSTKRWKRAKKDGVDNPEFSCAQEHGYLCREDQDHCGTEVDFSSPSCFGGMGDISCVYTASGTPELLYSHHNGSLTSTPMIVPGFPGQVREDIVLPFIELPPSIQLPCANMQSHPMGWEVYRQRWDQESHFQPHKDYSASADASVQTDLGIMIENRFPEL